MDYACAISCFRFVPMFYKRTTSSNITHSHLKQLTKDHPIWKNGQLWNEIISDQIKEGKMEPIKVVEECIAEMFYFSIDFPYIIEVLE